MGSCLGNTAWDGRDGLAARCPNTGEIVGEGDKGQTRNCRKKQGSGNADKKWVTTEVMETQHSQDRKGWLVLGLLEVKETSESSVVRDG